MSQRIILASTSPRRRELLGVLGLSFDVSLRGSAPAFFETRHLQIRHGRVFNDVLRYTQASRANGELTIDGEREAVDNWYACRDHSWGIRSTMGPYAPLGGHEKVTGLRRYDGLPFRPADIEAGLWPPS